MVAQPPGAELESSSPPYGQPQGAGDSDTPMVCTVAATTTKTTAPIKKQIGLDKYIRSSGLLNRKEATSLLTRLFSRRKMALK